VVLVGEGRAGALGAGARRRGRGARPRGGGGGEARGRRDRRGEVAGADLPRAAPRPALGGRQDGRRHVRARRRRRSGGGGHGCRQRLVLRKTAKFAKHRSTGAGQISRNFTGGMTSGSACGLGSRRRRIPPREARRRERQDRSGRCALQNGRERETETKRKRRDARAQRL
jgi:hypothetical protein